MFAATAGLLLALAMGPAPAAVELHWQAPPGCPGQAALEREVAALLTDHAPPPQQTRPRLSFRVERQGPLWQLHGEITSQGLTGQRQLSAPSCEDLLAAAALLTAIVVDPGFGAQEPPPATAAPKSADRPPATAAPKPADPPPATAAAKSPGPSPTTAAAKSPGPTPATAAAKSPVPSPATAAAKSPGPTAVANPPNPSPVPPKRVDRSPRIPPASPPGRASRPRPGPFFHLAGGLGLGALPAPAGLLRLTIGAHGRSWSAGLVQDLWLPRDGAVPDAPAVGGRFWLWSAGARGCGLLHAGRRLELPLCAAIAVGVMAGKGTGELLQAYRQTSLWAGITAGPGLRVTITRRLGLTLAADLLVILARPRFAIAGRGQACCDGTLGGQFTGGLELRLR